MRSAIEEWVRLDESRHRSWFHVGFLDELEFRGGSLERAPPNEPSRGWYVAGVVLALADRGRRVAIADLFDLFRDDLTRLLDDTHEACGHAALAIFEALCETGRRAEALATVAPAAVCRGGEEFLDLLVYESRDVADRASSAEIAAFAALLDGVVKALEQAGSTIPPEFTRESALLCAREHRRRGEFEWAALLLDRIESSTPQSFKERESIERGFIACRMRSGSDALLPSSSADFPTIVAAIAPGLAHFESGVFGGARHPDTGEAAYLIGEFRLASGLVADAFGPLDIAVNALSKRDAGGSDHPVLARAREYRALGLPIHLATVPPIGFTVAATATRREPSPGSAPTADRAPNLSGSPRPSGGAADLQPPSASARVNDARRP